MAFVSGFHGAQVGENKSAAVCTTAPTKAVRNGDVSMAMVRKESRGRRTLAFNYRKNNVDTMIESGKKMTKKADEFFARSVTMQYKAFACPNGEYTTQCMEGSVKQAAFEKRAMALSAQFRARQASPAAKARAMFENRRHAIIAAGGCDHEEKLFTRFPQLSAAYTHGQTEAFRTCSRYAVPESLEEEYMAASVDRQMKERAAAGGVYRPACTEANQKGQAEQARVAALAVSFRSTQASDSTVTKQRYDTAKYGRDHFAHGCDYEESLFNKYPASAAAMRSKSYGY